MKMKKITAFIAAAAMLFSLSACSSGALDSKANPVTLANANGNTLVFIDGKPVENPGVGDGWIQTFYRGKESKTVVLTSDSKKISVIRDGKTVFADSYYPIRALASPAISDSGNVAYMSDDRTLCLYDAQTNSKKVIYSGEAFCSIQISPDGNSVLFSYGCYSMLASGHLPTYDSTVYKYVNGNVEKIGYGIALGISDNGEFVHYHSLDGNIGYRVIDADGNRIFVEEKGPIYIMFNKDYTKSAICSPYNDSYNELYLYDCRTKKIERVYKSESSEKAIYPAEGFINGERIGRILSDSLCGTLFYDASTGCFIRFDSDNKVETFDVNATLNFDYNESTQTVYYMDNNSSLFRLNLSDGSKLLICGSCQCFGVLPDGSGVYYSDENNNFFFTGENGTEKSIDGGVTASYKDGLMHIGHYSYTVGNKAVVYYNNDKKVLCAVSGDKSITLDGYDKDERLHHICDLGENKECLYDYGNGIMFSNVQYLPLYKTLPDGGKEIWLLDGALNLTKIGTY